MTELAYVKSKIIDFQKKILELKHDLRQLQDIAAKDTKRDFLEQLEWFDLLSLSIEDLTQHLESADLGNKNISETLVLIKPLERLKNKMQRYFESHSIVAVTPKSSNEDNDCIKVIETRSNSVLPEGTVLEIIRRGYRWKGQALRKAELITVRN